MTTAPTLLTEVLDTAPDLAAPDTQADPYAWTDVDDDVPAPAPLLTLVPKRSLAQHISGVEFIADTIESMDDSEMSDLVRTELSRALVVELAGTRAKVDSTCGVLAMWEGLEASGVREIERLQKRVAKFARMRDRLEAHVEAVMTASKLDKLEGDTNTLTLRKNPPAVRVDVDVAALPKEYLRYGAPPPPPPPTPDKMELKRALTAGVEIDGVKLVQTCRLVRS